MTERSSLRSRDSRPSILESITYFSSAFLGGHPPFATACRVDLYYILSSPVSVQAMVVFDPVTVGDFKIPNRMVMSPIYQW